MTERYLKHQPVLVHTWDGDEEAMRKFSPTQVLGFKDGNVIIWTPLITEGIAFPPGSFFLRVSGCPRTLNFSPLAGVNWEDLLLE